jgi:hypothetical protein
MSTRVVAIHQPNFFPWLGYFNKIVRADVFILLDHVQYPKPRGNWSNRVKVLVNGVPTWMTMPVEHNYPGFRRIDEIRVDERTPWRRKLVNLLQPNYSRAAAFKTVFPVVREWIECPADRVVDYNLNAVTGICDRLGISTAHLVRSSTLGMDGSKSRLLIDLITAVGGNVYLTGDGAGGYMEEGLFAAAGIEVMHQQFQHPAYDQGHADFVPGLSIVDPLLHCGFERTAQLVRSTGPV